MRNRHRLVGATSLAGCIVLAGCQHLPAPDQAEAPMPEIVASNCAGCHAVTTGSLSPNPAAPSFVDLANMPGLTSDTLAAFLSDAHNYPDQMDVEVDDEEVAAITRYILTLKDEAYRRPPS